MSGQINTNTVTNVVDSGAEPIQKTGSSADVTSFDELEALTTSPKSSPKSNKKQESKPKKDDEGKKSEKEEAHKKDDEPEITPDEVEQTSEKQDAKESSKEKASKESKSDKPKDGKTEVNQSVKTYKVRNGDNEMDLRSDTKLEVIVDGKKEQVSVQELINNHSGKENWGRKFQELDKQQKTFQSSKKALEDGIQHMVELSKTDALKSLEYFYEVTGQNGRELMKQVKDQILKYAEEFAKLSPQEREKREMDDELQYQRSKVSKYEAERAREAQEAELSNRIQATQNKYNLDKQTFVSRYEELVKLKSEGHFAGEVTPETVGEYHQYVVMDETVREVLNEVNPEMEDKQGAFKDLYDVWVKNPELTKAEITAIAHNVFGAQVQKKLAAKVKKTLPRGQTQSAPAKSKSSEPLFFDDLE